MVLIIWRHRLTLSARVRYTRKYRSGRWWYARRIDSTYARAPGGGWDDRYGRVLLSVPQ